MKTYCGKAIQKTWESLKFYMNKQNCKTFLRLMQVRTFRAGIDNSLRLGKIKNFHTDSLTIYSFFTESENSLQVIKK